VAWRDTLGELGTTGLPDDEERRPRTVGERALRDRPGGDRPEHSTFFLFKITTIIILLTITRGVLFK
jgi:hypothetical protein